MSKTPKQYIDNFKKGIITSEMLADVLFSFNKRAKNKRDKIREMCNYHYYSWKLDKSIEKYENDMDLLYQKKSKILSFFTPECIHKQDIGKRIRVYDYEDNYEKLYKQNDVIWENSYFDYDTGNTVCFFDYVKYGCNFLWFKYYVIGERGFHQPINDSDVKTILTDNNFTVIDIDNDFKTEGADINQLLSLQFCDKIYNLFLEQHTK